MTKAGRAQGATRPLLGQSQCPGAREPAPGVRGHDCPETEGAAVSGQGMTVNCGHSFAQRAVLAA